MTPVPSPYPLLSRAGCLRSLGFASPLSFPPSSSSPPTPPPPLRAGLQGSNGTGRYLKEAWIRIVRGMDAGAVSPIW
jgi:hypothetical protein